MVILFVTYHKLVCTTSIDFSGKCDVEWLYLVEEKIKDFKTFPKVGNIKDIRYLKLTGFTKSKVPL